MMATQRPDTVLVVDDDVMHFLAVLRRFFPFLRFSSFSFFSLPSLFFFFPSFFSDDS
jgi:hypothetical protein